MPYDTVWRTAVIIVRDIADVQDSLGSLNLLRKKHRFEITDMKQLRSQFTDMKKVNG